MNKTAIKNFAVWARNKLIADISYRAGLMGITESGIASALPQSTGTTEFYDIGTAEPYSISGDAVRQRRRLVELIERKAKETDYKTAYRYIIEEVAYTWFNRLIAIRFMEVNDYLPSHIRVLSSESGKMEPDLVTTPFDAELDFSKEEEQNIIQLKMDNKLDDVFRILFIKQCNALNEILPVLFETTNDYTELLLNLSIVDQEGIIYHLIHDIDEAEFNIEKEGQVEIIGWLYQYYNTEPKDETFGLLKKNVKITQERIPAATQLFTPDWIVRYMVENSLGNLWISGHPNDELLEMWNYYLEEPIQEPEVQRQIEEIRNKYGQISLENLKLIDPCMGSGHILVYCFDILMQIYESQGYTQRDAVKLILENNLFGLDIDKRATQLAYFAIMMKARQYDRRIFSREIKPHVYVIEESNDIERNHLDYFGYSFEKGEKNKVKSEIINLMETFKNAKEYGSILRVGNYDWKLLKRWINDLDNVGQITFDSIGIEQTKLRLLQLVEIGNVLAQKYDVVITNPPYMSNKGMNAVVQGYISKYYKDYKSDMFAVFMVRCMEMTKPNGMCSMVTMQAWLFIKTFKKLREYVLNKNILSLLQIGYNSFPELNSQIAHACSFVLQNAKINNRVGTFFNLDNGNVVANKEEVFLNKLSNRDFYLSVKEDFEIMPDKVFAYWLSENTIDIYKSEKVLSDISKVTNGLFTCDNDRFLRMWYEVNFDNINLYAKSTNDTYDKKWYPYNKGGNFRKWYGNHEYVVNYFNNATEIREYRVKQGQSAAFPGEAYYFQESLSWSFISSDRLSIRYYPRGFVFDIAGSSIFANERRNYILGFLASNVTDYLLKINPTVNFQAGNIASLPIIVKNEICEQVEKISTENIEISRKDWNSFETSWDFEKHPLIRNVSKIEKAYEEWELECNNRFDSLKSNEETINQIFINVYELQSELSSKVKDKEVTIHKADLGRDVKSLLSYAIGCMFGRYSLDKQGIVYAGGDFDINNYTLFRPDIDGILPIADEEYLEDDIVSRLCEWLKVVYGTATLEDNLNYIAKAFGNKGNSAREIIRNYFLNDFEKDHIKMYQKRPIYWLYDSGKQNGFKALVYMHRFNADTIGNLRVDYLHRMQRIYESEINRMQDMIDHSANTREVAVATKRKEKLQKQLKECREYDEKIGHLALSRIDIALDDGVKVNYEKVQTASDGKKYQVLAKI